MGKQRETKEWKEERVVKVMGFRYKVKLRVKTKKLDIQREGEKLHVGKEERSHTMISNNPY